jgi:hypothetical protein
VHRAEDEDFGRPAPREYFRDRVPAVDGGALLRVETELREE